jgi:hypothetical protein
MVCLIIYTAGFILLTQRFGQVSFSDQLMFLLSQAAFVLVPGMAVAQVIQPQKNIIKLVMLSYLLGIVLVILEFYVFYALGAQDYLLIGMAGVALLGVWYLLRNRDKLRDLKADNKSGWVLSMLLAGFLTLVFFSALYASKVPDLGGHPYMNYYQDLLWNAGNTTAIASGFPVMDIHVAGLTFSYHFFTNVFLAAFKNILGVSSFVLYFKFLPVLQLIVFISALYLFFSQISKSVWLRAALVAVAFFSSIVFMRHMLWQAYATLFALAFTVVAAAFFIRIFKNIENVKIFKNRDFLLFLIFLCMAIGTKSLFAVVLIAGVGIVFLVQIIRRKNSLQILWGGLSMLAVLAFMVLTMVLGTHTYNSLSIDFLTPMMGENPAYFQSLLAAIGPAGAAFIAYPLFLFLKHTVLVLASVMLVCFLVRKRKADPTAVFLLSGILAGIIAASVFFQPGYSNALFMEAAVPFGIFAIYYVLKNSWENEKVKKAAKIILFCVVAGVLAVGVLPTIRTVAQDWKTKTANQYNVSPYDGISVYEYEGMEWLKENTPEDAMVASDRMYFVPGEDPYYARYFYYTAFSERTNYLEGYYYINTYADDYQQVIDSRIALLKRVYAGDQFALAELADQDVDYLVSSKFITPEFWLDTSLGETVYQNEGMTIYRLYHTDEEKGS